MRVLHVIDSLSNAGAERLLVDYVTEMRKTMPEVGQYVCTLQSLKDELSLPEGLKRINLGFNKWNLFSVSRKLNKFVKENKIDIVHAHLLNSILISRLLITAPVKKKIFTYHNLYFDKKFAYYSGWRTLAERLTYKQQYVSVFVSEEIKKSVERVRRNNGRGVVLNNFCHPSFHYNYQVKDRKELSAVIVANLRKTKNLNHVIQELAQLKSYPVGVDIYGVGTLRDELEAMIKATGANVVLKGSANITSDLLSQYDVFLMTSESEGMPISLLESMSTGLPCVLPEHLEIFKRVAGNCSVFYSIYKQGALADQLKKLLEDKGQLKVLSDAARENAKLYSVSGYVNSLMELYER